MCSAGYSQSGLWFLVLVFRLPVDTSRRNTTVGLSQAAVEVCPPWTMTAAQRNPGRLGN